MINNPKLAVDISDYDIKINPSVLLAAGVEAVIIKSGSGMTRAKRFLSHGEACAKAGMQIMAYHWDDIIYDPVAQAEWALENIRSSGLPVRFLWGDQEMWWTDWYKWNLARQNKLPLDEVPRASGQAISSHNQAFMSRLQQLWKQTGLYTSYGFVASWAPPMRNWVKYYRLWVAHYGNQPKKAVSLSWDEIKQSWRPKYSPLLPPGANPEYLVAHQFSGDRFKVDGVFDSLGQRMPTDLNEIDGNFLQGIYANSIPANLIENPSHPIVDGNQYVVTVDSLCVRSGPGTSYKLVAGLVKNQPVTVAEISGGWAKLKEPYPDRYCFAMYLAGIPTS